MLHSVTKWNFLFAAAFLLFAEAISSMKYFAKMIYSSFDFAYLNILIAECKRRKLSPTGNLSGIRPPIA